MSELNSLCFPRVLHDECPWNVLPGAGSGDLLFFKLPH
jgi:hypothetical protein